MLASAILWVSSRFLQAEPVPFDASIISLVNLSMNDFPPRFLAASINQEEARAKQEEAESLIAAKEAEAQARQEALIAQKEQAKREKEEERQRRARERQIESFTRSVTNTFGREITKKATRTLFGILKK